MGSTCSSTRAAGSWDAEITNIRSCDIVVIVGGRIGTLGEFAIAYDEGRLALIPEITNHPLAYRMKAPNIRRPQA